jgi:phage/plasmid-associated DNA primase
MLGNYSYVLPSEILLKPLKVGNNPEVANMNNKRFVIAREPDKNFMFNCATIKEITGGGEVNARLNYSNDTKTNLNLTFILECNEEPKLNEVNDALSRRILDIPFKNRFVDKDIYDTLDDEEKKTTFLINKFYKTNEFKEKYKITLFLILCEYYREYYNNNNTLPIPDEILKRNRQYLANSDELLSWFDDNFIKTNNKKDIIKLKIVYDIFKNSEYFNNLNKLQKRQNNYKHFIEKIENNMFLKKLIIKDCHGTQIITNYIQKNKFENNELDL